MTAFRQWLKWIFHGRAELRAMRIEFDRRIGILERAQVTISVSPPDVRESPQRKPEPVPVRTRSWREFVQQVEKEEPVEQ